MKKLILSLFAVALLASTGCKSGGASSSDPKATLISFFKAMSKKDFAAAKKMATKESESMFSLMEMGMNMADKMDKKEADEAFNKFDDAKMEFGEAKIEGDKATVPVTHKDEKETANFILKKEDGAWKVAFDKASMAEMGGEKMKRENANDENFNMDSLTNAMKNLNSDSLQKAIKEGMGALDSLNKVLKEAGKQ
jgi:Domain of unknown function (DUF4878)